MNDPRVDVILGNQEKIFEKLDQLKDRDTELIERQLKCKIECNQKISKLKLGFMKLVIIALLSGAVGGSMPDIKKNIPKIKELIEVIV